MLEMRSFPSNNGSVWIIYSICKGVQMISVIPDLNQHKNGD